MKTILHIGTSKTGSTSLQNTLLRSRAVLQAHGVDYPLPMPQNFNNHKTLLIDNVAFERLPRHFRTNHTAKNGVLWNEAFFQLEKRKLMEEIATVANTSKIDHLVLSSESFSTCSRSQASVDRLKHDLAQCGISDILVAVYVRRPSAHFTSSVNQRLRASYQCNFQGAFRRATYKERLGFFLETFGRENVLARVYDHRLLLNGDGVDDFCSNFLAESGLECTDLARTDRDNISLSGEASDIVRQYRFDFHSDNENRHAKDSSRLVRRLRDLDEIVGPKRARLHQSVADAVDYSGTDALWLRDELGVVFPDFDYARLERGQFAGFAGFDAKAGNLQLDQIMQIDQDRRHRLLEALLETDWTAEDDARGEWVTGLLRKSSSR